MKRRPDPDQRRGEPIDAERLATLLDGALDDGRRAELLTRLAGDEEAQAALADAAAALAELEAEAAGGTSDPHTASASAAAGNDIPGAAEADGPGAAAARATPPARRPAPGWRWLALAAMLALLALVPWAWVRTLGPAGPTDPARLVSLLDQRDAGLPAAWDDRPWTVTRAPGDPLDAEVRAVRLGARLVGVELTARAGDPDAGRLAREVAALLDGIPAAGPVATLYREVAGRAGEPYAALEPTLARGATAVMAVAEPAWVELGAWAEAARVASTRRDAGFFRTRASREALARAGRLLEAETVALAALTRARTAATSSAPIDWPALHAELTALLAALGSQGGRSVPTP